MKVNVVSFIFVLECIQVNACVGTLCYTEVSRHAAMTFERFREEDIDSRILEIKLTFFGSKNVVRRGSRWVKNFKMCWTFGCLF